MLSPEPAVVACGCAGAVRTNERAQLGKQRKQEEEVVRHVLGTGRFWVGLQ